MTCISRLFRIHPRICSRYFRMRRLESTIRGTKRKTEKKTKDRKRENIRSTFMKFPFIVDLKSQENQQNLNSSSAYQKVIFLSKKKCNIFCSVLHDSTDIDGLLFQVNRLIDQPDILRVAIMKIGELQKVSHGK